MNTYSQVTYITNRAAAAAISDEIDLLRERCGQKEDLSTDLHHLFSMHNPKLRSPMIVLFREGGELQAAVFFFQRRLAGVGTGFFRVGDQTGDGSVVAMPGDRERALRTATDLLLKKVGVHTIAGALSESTGDQLWPAHKGRVHTRMSVRTVQRRMPLQASYEKTLAQLSGTMRKKVRAARRKAEERYQLEVVPNLTIEAAEQAFVSLASKALPHRSQTEIDERIAFMRKYPGAFCAGLRNSNGDWMALASGWRTAGSTYVSWQIHNEEYKNMSLNYIFSSYLLEQESNAQQQELVWVGGTNARWQANCKTETCLYILRYRQGVRSQMLKLAANFILVDSAYHICEEPTRPPDEGPGADPSAHWKTQPSVVTVRKVPSAGASKLGKFRASFRSRLAPASETPVPEQRDRQSAAMANQTHLAAETSPVGHA